MNDFTIWVTLLYGQGEQCLAHLAYNILNWISDNLVWESNSVRGPSNQWIELSEFKRIIKINHVEQLLWAKTSCGVISCGAALMSLRTGYILPCQTNVIICMHFYPQSKIWVESCNNRGQMLSHICFVLGYK